MNITKEELQDKLKNLKALRTVGQICIDKANESHIKDDAGMAKSIAKIEQAIAEESKPKLRHGDYGYDRGGGRAMSLYYAEDDSDDILRRVSKTCVHTTVCNDTHEMAMPHLVLGNIFDDLTALSEDVEYTEVRRQGLSNMSIKASDDHMYINMRGGFGLVQLPIEIMPEFILKTRQVLATLQRKEASK